VLTKLDIYVCIICYSGNIFLGKNILFTDTSDETCNNKAIYIRCMFYGFMVFNATFQQYFSYIVAVSFIGGGNGSTRRKPPTYRKVLTNFIT